LLYRCLYRRISRRVAIAVIKVAAEEGRLGNDECVDALEHGDEALENYIEYKMYDPAYKSLIRLPTGVLE
jgi:hypothetical protein